MHYFFIATSCQSLERRAKGGRERKERHKARGRWFLTGLNTSRTERHPQIHPAQKSVKVLKKLIKTFTDEGDVLT